MSVCFVKDLSLVPYWLNRLIILFVWPTVFCEFSMFQVFLQFYTCICLKHRFICAGQFFCVAFSLFVVCLALYIWTFWQNGRGGETFVSAGQLRSGQIFLFQFYLKFYICLNIAIYHVLITLSKKVLLYLLLVIWLDNEIKK